MVRRLLLVSVAVMIALAGCTISVGDGTVSVDTPTDGGSSSTVTEISTESGDDGTTTQEEYPGGPTETESSKTSTASETSDSERSTSADRTETETGISPTETVAETETPTPTDTPTESTTETPTETEFVTPDGSDYNVSLSFNCSDYNVYAVSNIDSGEYRDRFEYIVWTDSDEPEQIELTFEGYDSEGIIEKQPKVVTVPPNETVVVKYDTDEYLVDETALWIDGCEMF